MYTCLCKVLAVPKKNSALLFVLSNFITILLHIFKQGSRYSHFVYNETSALCSNLQFSINHVSANYHPQVKSGL